jgi:hypothetical protein
MNMWNSSRFLRLRHFNGSFSAGLLPGLLAASIALGGALPAAALGETMYTWKDENGVVHFSDRAPEGQDLQAQQLPEAPKPGSVSPTGSTAASPANAEPSVAQQRREEIARMAEENQARQQAKQVQCTSWRTELERLEPNRRVYFENEQGETERMDDVERTDRVAELHELIDKNCD